MTFDKISDVINKLEELKEKHGDIIVVKDNDYEFENIEFNEEYASLVELHGFVVTDTINFNDNDIDGKLEATKKDFVKDNRMGMLEPTKALVIR